MAEVETVRVDYRQDSLPLAAGLYEAFLAKGKAGRDGLLVYLHLLYTYRRQGTNQPWATKSYLEQGLRMGHRRISIARSLLSEMGLIGYVRDRSSGGRLGKVYTRLNLVPNPSVTTGPETGPMVNASEKPEDHHRSPHRRCGSGRQMLEERINPIGTHLNVAVAKAPAAAKAKKPKGPQSALTDLFFRLYELKTGNKPPWTGAEGKLLKGDLARLGAEKLERLIRLFFDDPPVDVARWASTRGHDYRVGFHPQLPKLEAALAAGAHRLSLVRVCPHCGTAQEHTGTDCIACRQPMKGVDRVA